MDYAVATAEIKCGVSFKEGNSKFKATQSVENVNK